MAMVSVIMPLYNKGSLVVRALDSIFAQTFQDFELVVVDDGSTDNGPEIVKTYKDHRLQLIHQPNAGPGAARNTGVRQSLSPYVAFLDADDEWLPDFLQSSLANLQSNPDCVLTVANHYRGIDKILATTVPPCNIGIATGPWRLTPEIEPKEMWGSLFYLQSLVVVCRRDVVLEFGGFYEHHCTYLEDQYLWLQILLNYRIYRDTTPLCWYHTEDSELADSNRKSPIPLFPFLSEPEPILRNCPVEYRLALKKLLLYVAALNFSIMISQDDTSAAKYLLKQFPMTKYFREYSKWIFTKQRIKVAVPWLIPCVRILKQFKGTSNTT
jgi:glycosyltransferase involved in cell wall biosynthesis